jgi:hypothetical protein
MATEILRPNAAGDETNLTKSGSGGDNYDRIDETSPDGDATYVASGDADYIRDLYNLDDSGVGAGNINKVTVYARCRSSGTISWASLKICIKSGTGDGAPDTVSEGSEITLNGMSYEGYSNEWSTNPATGLAWTWDEIDKLQAGLSGKRPFYAQSTLCTQFYVEVDYTDITEKASSDSGSGSDARTSGSPLASLSKLDSGSAAEGAPTQEAALAGSEGGSGAEAIRYLLGKLVSDGGSGNEDSYLAIITCARQSGDGGVGADSSGLLAELTKDEAGSAVESLLSRQLRPGDSGHGNDLRVTLYAVLSSAETGSGTGALLSRLVAAAETALGTEGLPSRKIGRYDHASGAEASAIYKMLIAADGGSGLEALSGLIVLIPASELGHGLERLGAKIMTSPGAIDYKLPADMGKTEIPRR